MKLRTQLLACAAFCAASTTPVAAAWGAELAADATVLEDVIVTARRTEENIQNVPLAVTARTGDQLLAAGIREVTDLKNLSPGLMVTGSGLGDRANLNFVIRGQGIVYGQVNQSVITYFNDVPVAAVGPSLFFDLANVQVLKGPQGTLFGKNTTGGAILFEPNRPGPDFEGKLTARVGNYDLRGVEGFVNVPFVPDRVMGRLAVNIGKRDGFTYDLTSRKHLDDQDYIAFRLGLTVKFTDELENYLVLNAYRSDTNGSGVVPHYANPTSAAATRLFPTLRAVFAGQDALGIRTIRSSIVNPYRKDLNLTLVDTLTWSPTDWLTIKNVLGLSKQRYRSAFDNDGSTLPLLEFPARADYQYNQESISEELQASIRALDGRLNLIGGYFGSFSHPVGGNPMPGSNTLTITGFSNRFNNSILRGNSFYLQGDFEVMPRLTINAGIRYNNDHQTNFAGQWGTLGPTAPYPTVGGCQVPGAPVSTCVFRSERNWKHTSYLIGANYQLSDDAMAYVVVRNGYKSGGLNGFIPDPSFSLYNPEIVDDVEVGLKTSYTIGGIETRANVDVYRGKYKGLQRSTVLITPLGVYAPIFNAAGARVQGFEFDGQAAISDWLRLAAFFAYTDAKYTNYKLGVVDVSYTRFSITPEYQWGLTATVNLPVPDEVGRVSLTANYYWQDRIQFTNVPKRRPQGGPVVAPSDIQAFDMLNLRADWKGVYGSKVDLGLFVTNAKNSKDRTFEAAYYDSVGFTASNFVEPRMYGVELTYNF